MSIAPLTWTSRNEPASGKFFVFAGRAYPRVWKGENPTDIVQADDRDRKAFYHDPAVMLSDANLESFNGTEKAPLFLEHKTNRVVGFIHHSFLGDGDVRALKIIGRIPTQDDHGRPINQDVVADIKAGKYTGLSVGYGTNLSKSSGTTKLSAKTFREISLVSEPFFDNCQLSSVSIFASKEGTKNLDYLTRSERQDFKIDIQMSAEISNNSEQQQQQQQQQQKHDDSVPAAELLRQADSLKAEAEAKGKEAAVTHEMVKKLQAQLAELQSVNSRFAAKDKAERETYAKASEEELASFLTYLEESGATLTDAKKEAYKQTFLNPDLKDYKADLMAGQRRTVDLMASKHALEVDNAAKLKAEQEKAKMLQDTVAKTTQVLNHSRNAFAQTMSSFEVSKEDASDAQSRQVAVTAGKHLNQIMCAEPSAVELPWLRDLGYSNEVDVTASARGFQTSKPFPTHFAPAPEHRHLYDSKGEPELSNSMRYHAPSFYSMLCQQAGVDLKMAGVRASFIDETLENRAEDWEARHMLNTQTQGVTIHK